MTKDIIQRVPHKTTTTNTLTNYAHASLIPGVNMSSVIRSRSGFLYLSRARDAALGDIYGMVHRQACHVPSIGNAEHSNLQVK